MKIFKKSLAFTLAEVLITIGVIGVVAAITIPSLITISRKVMVENRLKDTYSILANATRLAEGEFGADIDPSEMVLVQLNLSLFLILILDRLLK